ncbi:MAG: acyltransferase [Hyphomicrobiales bacterium]|nr:acyltransferase [Hyphomicrobiales bacterium]
MSLWEQAKSAAGQTPPYRNRTADFFRAAAITVVIFGHWLVSVPYYVDGSLQFTILLSTQPWTQYVTWLMQVMPIFFFVGGFSNAASWASAQHDPAKRRAWQASRLKRLLMPITPLILLWSLFASIAGYAGLDPDIIRTASQAALIPVWFLAVYIMVTVIVPITAKAWEKFGLWSVAFLVFGAAMIDFIAFAGGVGWVRWSNYAFVWLGMHQLGYWWFGGVKNKVAPVLLIAAGLVSLYVLIGLLGYPVAMISVPGEEVSNTRPPTFAMFAIGFTQVGLILLVTDKVANWLQNPKPWAVVILVGQRIMTVYLWHLTALLIVVGLMFLADGFGLRMLPGTSEWWLSRPLWIAAMSLVMLPLIFVFGRLESGSRQSHVEPPGPLRSALGACLACGGLTFLALDGTYANNTLGVNIIPVSLAIAGVALSTINWRHSSKNRSNGSI